MKKVLKAFGWCFMGVNTLIGVLFWIGLFFGDADAAMERLPDNCVKALYFKCHRK